MKRVVLYRVVAEAIITQKTFDLAKENGNGFKTIAEMITLYLLRDCDGRGRLRKFERLLPSVRGVLFPAKEYLEGQGIPLYKDRPKGKRNVQFITVLKGYRKARDRDTARGVRQVETQVNKTVKHLALANPTALPEFKQKLLGGW